MPASFLQVLNYWKQGFESSPVHDRAVQTVQGFFVAMALLAGVAGGAVIESIELFAQEVFWTSYSFLLTGIYIVAMLAFAISAVMARLRNESFLRHLLQSRGESHAAIMLVAHAMSCWLYLAFITMFLFVFPIPFFLLISMADWAGEGRLLEIVRQFEFDDLMLIIMSFVGTAACLLALLPFSLFAVVFYEAPAGVGKMVLFVFRRKVLLHVIFLACYALAYRHYVLQAHMPVFGSSAWFLWMIPPAVATMLYLPLAWHSCCQTAQQPDKIMFRRKKDFSPKEQHVMSKNCQMLERMNKAICVGSLVLLPVILVSVYML